MKKNILLIFLLIVSASLVIYSYIKANDAEKAQKEAQLTRQEAERLSKKAVQLQERALDAAANAVKQQHLAEKIMEELVECRAK